MMRHAAVALLALCALLAGCPESIHPASDPSAAQHDERLFGSWQGEFEGDEIWLHVGPAERGFTSAVMVERKGKDGSIKAERYAAFPSRLGEELAVLNVRPLNGDAERAYTLFKYVAKKNKLTLWMASYNAVRADIRAGKLKGVAEEGRFGDTRITASTAEVAAYLVNADPGRLFDKPLEFSRVEP